MAFSPDVGEAGEKELEGETTARLGRRTGIYAALAQSLGLEYSPNDHTRLEPNAILGAQNISGTEGLDDGHQLTFQGLSFEMRYRLLDRRESGIGLALRAEPQWSRIDETADRPADQYGSELALLVDKELVSDRVIAAFNLLYDPQANALAGDRRVVARRDARRWRRRDGASPAKCLHRGRAALPARP